MDGTQQQRTFLAPTGAAVEFEPRLRVAQRAPAAWRVRLIVAFATLGVLFPFLFVGLPPLVDYPNHLARFWLLAGGVNDPALSGFYGVDWTKASTNIGADLAAALLGGVTPARTVAFVSAIAAALLPPIGVICLNRVVFRRFSVWQALFPIAAWSTTFLMGFLNFQIGVGLALLAAAADPWLRRRLGGFLGPYRAMVAAVLALDHLFALLFYIALIGAIAFGAAPLRGSWRLAWPRLRDAARAAVWCCLPLGLLALFAPALPGSDTQSVGTVYGVMLYKVFALATPMSAYNLLAGLAVTGALIWLAAWLGRAGALQAHAGLLVMGAAMLAMAILAPDHAAGGSWISRRFPTLAVLTLLAAAQMRPEAPAGLQRRFVALALTLVAAQTLWIAWNWRAMDANISSVRRALISVPAGARILPAQHAASLAAKWSAPAGRYMVSLGDPTFRHYAALATPERRAFVPNLFSAKGLQPLRVRGDWDAHVEHNGGELASVTALNRPWRTGDPIYLRGWRGRFDYLLVMNADLPDAAGPVRAPAGLVLVSDIGFAQLWRIAPLP